VARLSITLFGPLKVTLDGEAVGFESDKVRALLAYLAVESEGPHRREKLAGLLWPDWPERAARNNLRHALAVLRKALRDHALPPDGEHNPAWLHVTRQTVQFNAASDAWIDVTAFATLLQASPPNLQTLHRWGEAVELYQGDFLEGFSLPDSPAFEEWSLLTREQMRRQVMDALHRLAEAYGERGEHERALQYAWRQTELDPWREEAHQQVMRLLALSGRRSAALAQYETCRRLLAEELGVEPGRETILLYEQIRDGKLKAHMPSPISLPDLTARFPPFLEKAPPLVEMPVFVARGRELAQLNGFLDRALVGQGSVVFVTGEAGSGKTALVQEFVRRAQEAHADLIAASGNCNAYTGIGDPYLPFRELLQLLTGDVEARWAAGAITAEHARRLWNMLPLAAQALAEAGPDLLDTFVPRAALLERLSTRAPGGADWLARLDGFVERKPATGHGALGLQQGALFEQYTRVLQALARQGPLLLVVDDLQWADLGSISLLFHLGRRLVGSRIVILGTYRAEEVAVGRDGERHSLAPVLNEFRRDFGDVTVNLGRAERRAFIDALLDSEPNRLGLPFREMLYRQTRGHPLFTIELLRGMQERGDLVQDPDGRWVEGPALDWETLPARVEAVIAERIARLARPLRAALRVASVEGEVFTAEVIARVQAAGEREVVGRLSGELDRKHRLVCAQGILRIDGQRLSHYRFRHILIQRYLYSTLDEVERVHLHEQVGTALEGLYGAQEQAAAIAAVAVQLALHFQKAKIVEKAIYYLHRAGERAVQLSAYEEGIAHLTRGLALLKTLPDSPERMQQELALQLALGMAWAGPKGYGPEVEKAYGRARELCQQTGEMSQLCRIVGQLAALHYVRAEHQGARELGEEALSLAQQAENPLLVAAGHWRLGFISFALGEYTTARAHLKQMISFYVPQKHHRPLVSLRGSDAGVGALAYDACCLWCLGYPKQALKRSQEALSLARQLDHAYSLADVLCYAGCLFHGMRRDALALKDGAEELMRLSDEKGLVWLSVGTCHRGAALTLLGLVQEGMAQIREGMAVDKSMGVRLNLSGTLCSLAEAQAKAGQPEEGFTTLTEALALVEETDERYCEAELYRLRAELLLMQGDEVEAEISLLKAIEVARRQQAKSWELRATTSLARLWQRQGRRDDARALLFEIYGWFTEGFDTPDLMEAKALLDELAK